MLSLLNKLIKDIALKNRLQVDERIIRKVSKKLLSTKYVILTDQQYDI